MSVGRKKLHKDEAPDQAATPAAPEAMPKPVALAAEPTPIPAPSSAVAPAMPQKYRIKVTKRLSFFGQIITLHQGKVIDAGSYGGASGIARLVESGVELEAI